MKNQRKDIISHLPDDLLIRILSSLSLKDVMATSFLSGRWRSLWKLVPKLNINDNDLNNLRVKLVFNSLAFSNPQVLKSLDFKLIPGDIGRSITSFNRFSSLVKTAVHCGLRELRIELLYTSLELPTIFYACGTLETLILCRLSLVDDVPSYGSLSSLKVLRLLSVKFSRDESVQKLLSICPVLEELVVRRSGYSNVEIFTINVPTLTSLSIAYLRVGSQPVGVHGFVINAPSLRYLNIRDRHSNYLLFTNMPELVKANVEIVCNQSKSLIGSIASVRHLSLCSQFSNLQIPYHAGTSFVFLEHLELCTCSSQCWNLLARILKNPLRLRVLKLKSIHRAH